MAPGGAGMLPPDDDAAAPQDAGAQVGVIGDAGVSFGDAAVGADAAVMPIDARFGASSNLGDSSRSVPSP